MSEEQGEDYIGNRDVVLNAIQSPFLLPSEAARFLRIQVRTLNDYRTKKIGPTFRRHGGRILYHERDLQKWSEKQLGSS